MTECEIEESNIIQLSTQKRRLANLTRSFLITLMLAAGMITVPGIVAESPPLEGTAVGELLADQPASAADWSKLWPGRFTGYYVSGYPLYCRVSGYSGWWIWRKPVYDFSQCSIRRNTTPRPGCTSAAYREINLNTGAWGGWRFSGVTDCR